MKKKKLLLLGSLFITLCFFFLSGCEEKQARILKVGDNAPEFTLPDLKGNKVTVPTDFKGKVVIIRFWADWCTYCAKEMPELEVLYNKYKEKGLVIIAVNVGQPKEAAEAFVNKYKLSYPVLLDTYSVVAQEYSVIGLPNTFVLDRNGVVAERFFGETDIATLEKLVNSLL